MFKTIKKERHLAVPLLAKEATSTSTSATDSSTPPPYQLPSQPTKTENNAGQVCPQAGACRVSARHPRQGAGSARQDQQHGGDAASIHAKIVQINALSKIRRLQKDYQHHRRPKNQQTPQHQQQTGAAVAAIKNRQKMPDTDLKSRSTSKSWQSSNKTSRARCRRCMTRSATWRRCCKQSCKK